MFTGITTDLGRVRSLTNGDGRRLTVTTRYDTEPIALGASVACSGVCLSVVEKGSGWLAFDVSDETLRRTTIADWRAGDGVNLEQALRVGDELGGHMVLGHVDDVGEIGERVAEGESVHMSISVPERLSGFIAEKGSLAVDGVSLTVGRVGGHTFEVTLISHTVRSTAIEEKRVGDKVNIEVDTIARYVARIMSVSAE